MLRFCIKDGAFADENDLHDAETHTFHQNTLADLRVDDTLMAFVSQVFTTSFQPSKGGSANTEALEERLLHPSMKPFNDLAFKCYQVLRAMCKGNASVGYNVANKYKGHMTNQCRILGKLPTVSWDIADTLKAIFSENGLILKAVDENYVATQVHMIKEATCFHDLEEYFILLASLCVHDNEPIVDVQKAILHQIANLIPITRAEPAGPAHTTSTVGSGMTSSTWWDSQQNVPIKIQIRVQPADARRVHFEDWERQWVSLESFMSVECKDMPALKCYVAMLGLLSNLCFDRRHDSQVSMIPGTCLAHDDELRKRLPAGHGAACMCNLLEGTLRRRFAHTAMHLT